MSVRARPLVSCVICTHDYGAYVARAVRSALDQEGVPGGIEVIVVDDGSTDETPEVLAGFGDAISVLRQVNCGPAVGSVRGIAAARGRYVALLDADDEFLPGKLQRQLELLERRPQVGLVHGDMEIVDGDGTLVHASKFTRFLQSPVAGRALGALLCTNHVTTSAMLMPAPIARAVPPAPAWAWCRDWWFATHVAAAHELDFVAEPVVRYRQHGANFSGAADDLDRQVTVRHRDARVRRLLLRTLDLSAATLDELALAWKQLTGTVEHVAHHRGVDPASLLTVGGGDRAEAQRTLRAAHELLDDDPARAARLAMRARAADPHDSAARACFEEARGLAAARRPTAEAAQAPSAEAALQPTAAAAGQPVAEAAPQPSATAAPQPTATAAALPGAALDPDRVREIEERRAALAAAHPGETDLGALFLRFQQLEHLIAAVTYGGPPGTRLPEIGDADRERSIAAVADGLRALGDGDPAGAVARLVVALALDPQDAHARAVLQRALVPFGGGQPPADDLELRARSNAPVRGAVDGARAFVAVAFADELAQRPELLRGWAAQIGAGDDATLAIAARGGDAAAAQTQVVAALEAAGIPLDDGRDLALVALGDGGAGASAAALARQAHACWSDEPAPGPLAALPRLGAADAPRLRTLAERRWSHDGLGRALSIAIKICAPRWQGAESWGDLHYARALADELERRGHTARIDVVAEWDDLGGRACDVALHLRGLYPYVPHPGQLNVLWTISHPDLVTPAECDRFDLVFSASRRHAELLAARTRAPVAVLEQATDPAVFFPEPDPAHARELVLVGNSRGILRPIVRDLLPTDRDLAIWGSGWERFADARHVAGGYLPNDQVRRAYSSAAIVLNDHWDDMREQGLVSNRITDALACGALVLSDDLPELRERFGDAVVTYRTRAELRATVARLLADPAERAAIAARGRQLVLAGHTFAHRADVLLAAVADAMALKEPDPEPIPCT